MTLTCEKCNFVAKTSQAYNRHILTKKHQHRINDNAKYKCSCGKTYISAQCLYRHRRQCTYSPPNIETNTSEVQTLRKENQEMREEMDELRKQVESLMSRGTGNTTNRNSHNNTHIENQNNNNQNVNIVVNSFGNENIEHLTDKIVCKLIQAGPFTCLPKIIERIHFDPEHPENHNIKVTNQKNNYAKIVKDNKWVTTNKKQAIDTMIQNGYGLLEEKYQDNKDTISEFKQERFEDFQEKYCDQDKDLMKTIKDEVDIALLNGTGKLHK